MRDPQSTVTENTVVIGAGQAGYSFCAKLRELGYEGRITLIGDEPVLPYQRPPLSKAYMLGSMSADRLLLRPEEFYLDQRIDMMTGVAATRLSPDAGTVTLSDGNTVDYDVLVLATGSKPRLLPPAVSGNLKGVFYLRGIADADAIIKQLKPGSRTLVVGGGYIGLEAAATAAKLGMDVTLIEATERILQRVACSETSNYFRELHASHGTVVREGAGLECLLGTNGQVTGARLSDGQELEADLVLVGIGVVPNQELAEEAGLVCDNGVRVDANCRASAPGVLAIGDCASFPLNADHVRLESVGHAIDHAQAAAATVMGSDAPYVAKPWFWSDQHDVKLQIAGLSSGFNKVVVRPGEGQTQSHWYFKDDQLLAVDAMNDPRAYMVGKRLIEAGKSPSAEQVADESLDLKSLLAG